MEHEVTSDARLLDYKSGLFYICVGKPTRRYDVEMTLLAHTKHAGLHFVDFFCGEVGGHCQSFVCVDQGTGLCVREGGGQL